MTAQREVGIDKLCQQGCPNILPFCKKDEVAVTFRNGGLSLRICEVSARTVGMEHDTDRLTELIYAGR